VRVLKKKTEVTYDEFGHFAAVKKKSHLSNEPTSSTNSCFIMSLLYASTCFEHYVLIIRRSKLYYTASGIITPVVGRPVHIPLSPCARTLTDVEHPNDSTLSCVLKHVMLSRLPMQCTLERLRNFAESCAMWLVVV